MVVNRLSGLVPADDDEVSDGRRHQPRATGTCSRRWRSRPGAATLVDATTSFANSQVLGVAAQRAITEMRKDVEAHVMRLPIRYFDSTKTGVLISRIMSDAEGIRNLVGTGLVQLTGSILTAVDRDGRPALSELEAHASSRSSFSARSAAAWRRRSSGCGRCSASAARSTREVTGRLAESLGGVRIVKAYTAEKREELVFAKGAHRLFRNVAKSLTGVSAIDGVLVAGDRRDRHRDDADRRHRRSAAAR